MTAAAACARWREAHPERQRDSSARSRAKRAEANREYNRRYYEANKEQLQAAGRERSKARYWSNPEAMIAVAVEYRKNNLSKMQARHRDWQKEKLQTDIQFKLKANLRRRLSKAIRGQIKSGSAVKDLGCTVLQLIEWLGSKFSSGMTWDNYGSVWTIDHCHPLSAFELTDRAQLLAACHYTNLQPMFSAENIKKAATVSPAFAHANAMT
jgi:hypothetical protein